MKKIFTSLLIAVFLFSGVPAINYLSSGESVYAAQLVKVSGKLSKDRKNVTATFSNLKDTKNLTYTLTYTSNGVPQGVVGSIYPTKKTNSIFKNIFLGTCSGNVCRLHTNVKDLRLVVKGIYKSGKSFSISIKIKN